MNSTHLTLHFKNFGSSSQNDLLGIREGGEGDCVKMAYRYSNVHR